MVNTSRFEFHESLLSGVFKIVKQPLNDGRGSLSRFFCAKEFKEIGFSGNISQINHTNTLRKGVVRGMHFQYPPYSEEKIVTCIKGEVFDVVIDLRENSTTFLQWHAEKLSDRNNISLFIPKGFAHGFQTLTNNCQLIYLHSSYYKQDSEGAINALDPLVEVSWPLDITERSDRDIKHKMINLDFRGLNIL